MNVKEAAERLRTETPNEGCWEDLHAGMVLAEQWLKEHPADEDEKHNQIAEYARSIVNGIKKSEHPLYTEWEVDGAYRLGLKEAYEVAKAYLTEHGCQP